MANLRLFDRLNKAATFIRRQKPISFALSGFFLSLLMGTTVCAQFTDVSWQYTDWGIELKTPLNAYGSGVSFYDFNKDGWDDITMGGGESPIVFLKNNAGVLEPATFNIATSTIGNVQSILWVDFDHDGDPDFFVTRDNGPIELWENDGDYNFTNITSQAGLQEGFYRFTYSAWGDYNHDGFPDLYLALYYNPDINPDSEFANKLYRNNGDGTFTDVTESSGVSLPPRTTLQPVWIDVNNDGWEDLFLAVDRVLFPNELFINNHDGTFTHATTISGVDDYIDGMSAAIGDYNRDGFLDIYVSNNPIQNGNILYTNNGTGEFTNYAVEQHVNSMTPCWGAVWLDYNNNSWEDLFVAQVTFTPIGRSFFVNQSGEYFDELSNNLGLNTELINTFNCARGDLNNDGYYDLALSNRTPHSHQLFRNNGGENNFISVSLEGTISNTDGLGTWIHCYFENTHLVRYTTNSENFGGQNSGKQIFGLNEQAIVDSLVLEWSSGTREVYENPEINYHHHFTEGAGLSTPFEISFEGATEFCQGDSIVLDAGSYESYLWNTGDTTQQLMVEESGVYSVEVLNEFGLLVTSLPVEVFVYPASELMIATNHISCTDLNDGSLEISFSTGTVDSIIWSHGPTESSLYNLATGQYSFTASDIFGCTFSGEVFISQPSPLVGTLSTTDSDCFGAPGGTATSLAIGGTPPYTTNWNGQNPDSLFAGNYTATIIDTHGCELLLNYSINQPDSLWIELETSPSNGNNTGSVNVQVFGGTAPFQTEWSTGESGSFELSNLAPGQYFLNISDGNGCELDTTFTIDNTTLTTQNTETPIRMFPNPARNEIYLMGCSPGNELTLYDIHGNQVLHQLVDRSSTEISTDHLPGGTYLLVVQEEHSQQAIRLILVR